MNKRNANSATIRTAGEMALQDPYLSYNYENFNLNDVKNQIPTKAQGKIGARYYEAEAMDPPGRINEILQLKKKLKHKHLEEEGYLVNHKQKAEDFDDMNIPVYEIFDQPNPHYRKQFIPEEKLTPVVAYYFDEQYDETVFVDEIDKKLEIDGQEKENKKNHRKDLLLKRINQNIKQQQQKSLEEFKKHHAEEAIQKIVQDTKNSRFNRYKRPERKTQTNKSIEWVEPEKQQDQPLIQKVGRRGQKLNDIPLNHSSVEKEPKSILKNSSTERKHVRFDESITKSDHEDVIQKQTKPKPPLRKQQTQQRQDSEDKTKWRDKSNALREAMKAARQK